MAFHSLSFIFLLLPFGVLGSRLLVKAELRGTRVLFLLLLSLVFYSLSSWQTLPILAGSVFLNFYVSRLVSGNSSPEIRRRWLITGLALNLSTLGVWKYAHFTVDNLNALTGLHWYVPSFALPLGLSFFTLQQIMYLVDCYEGLALPVQLRRHALLIAFFPYVSAGPIVRANDFFRQLDRASPTRCDVGLARFIVGLCKKVVLADLCGKLADSVFDSPLIPGFADGWIAALAFSLQLYFDFSGYSDMAVGIAEMLGLELPQNFDAPLRSSTVIEFWTRWHITLSKFITTYLYTPMVKALPPITFNKSMVFTVIAMSIAGLWHGAAWPFVLFGLAHGLAITANHVWRKRMRKHKLPPFLARVLTLIFVVAAFVMFRSHSVLDSGRIYGAMLGLRGGGGLSGPLAAISRPEMLICLSGFLVALAAAMIGPSTKTLFEEFRPTRRWVIASVLLGVLALAFMNASATKGFIYRDF